LAVYFSNTVGSGYNAVAARHLKALGYTVHVNTAEGKIDPTYLDGSSNTATLRNIVLGHDKYIYTYDSYFVWSAYWPQAICRTYGFLPPNVIITGSLSNDIIYNRSKSLPPRTTTSPPYRVLIIGWIFPVTIGDKCARYMASTHSLTESDINILIHHQSLFAEIVQTVSCHSNVCLTTIRRHPWLNQSDPCEHSGVTHNILSNQSVRYSSNSDVIDDIASHDLVLSYFSTVNAQAALIGIPAFSCISSTLPADIQKKLNIADGITDNPILSQDDINSLLIHKLRNRDFVDSHLEIETGKYFFHFGPLHCNASKAISDRILSSSSQPPFSIFILLRPDSLLRLCKELCLTIFALMHYFFHYKSSSRYISNLSEWLHLM